VVNFAAESHVDRSIDSSAGFIHSNVVGVQVLLDACRRHKVQRFVQVGTDEAYGDLAEGEVPADEQHPLRPSSPYSASKTAADLLTLSYVRTFGLDAVVTRCSNNYGPYQYPEKLIPLMTLRALRDEKLPVYGDGLQVRDWIHVTDHAVGIMFAAMKGKAGEVYNFGGENQMTNIAIVSLILRALDKSDSLIEHVTDRPGHDRRYAIDCQKALRELGCFRSKRPEAGIVETVLWYKEHESWWRPLLEKGATQRRGK
jgi:dTDP-glucose 4,6-dehydratase